MTVITEYITVLLLQTVLILQGSNGLWSPGPRQEIRHFQPQQDCCKTDNYIGLVPPTPPSYDRYRYEGFQNHPRAYQEGYHNKQNQYSNYNRRYLPSKHSSYSKDYYRKGQNHIPSYIQRRTDFVDDYYVKRPYNRAENELHFRNSPINRSYYDKDYRHNDRESESDKYFPGLLLSSIADRSGTIIVTDPDGVKHRINSFSLKEFEVPESKKPFYSALGNNDPVKDAKPYNGFPEELKIPSAKDLFSKNSYIYPNHRTAVMDAHYDISFSANPQKEYKQNNGDTSSSAIRFPTDVNDFHPSPPFHTYSEPDPLFHPNGSPLQTHASQFVTSPPTTATPFPTPRRQSTYPDSINAQLPHNNEDTNVPYVRDEVQDTKSTSATQATKATQKRLSLAQITPTTPSTFSTPGDDKIPSSTQRSTREDQKKWDFLPTVQEISSSPMPHVLNVFSTPYTFSTESPTHATISTAVSTATPELKILPSISNLDNNSNASIPNVTTKLYFPETLKSKYELQQEPTTETQPSVNTTTTQTTTAASTEPEIHTDTQSTVSVFEDATGAMEEIENVTKLEEFFFNSMSNVSLTEETTTVMPDNTHTY